MKVWIILSLLVFAIIASQGQAANIALNKPARQSSDQGLYPASKAVNGRKTVVDDFSHTKLNETVHWWKVDLEGDYLIKNVIIYNRLGCCLGKLRLREFYVLTSNISNPGDPSPISDKWIIRHYQHDEVGFKATNSTVNFNLYTTDTVRHVAVYTMNTEPLNLAEVEVYDYSHSEDAPVNQIVSGTAANFNGAVTSPAAAVDGNTNMFSAPFTTVNSQSSWVVKLKQSCGSFCYIRVYPRLDKNNFNDAGFTNFSRLQTLTYHEETLPNQNSGVWIDKCDVYGFPQKGPLLQICEAAAIWFIRLVNFDQGQIQFTEVQVFSRGPAEIQSINLQNQHYGCVDIFTSPATIDRATSYRFKCAGKNWSERRSSSSAQSCGHVPGSTITCQVVAVGEGGVNQSQPQDITLKDCQNPSKATFNVEDIGTNDEKTARNIRAYDIQVEINCDSLKNLTVSVKEQDQDVGSKIISDLTADVNFDGLKANTIYTVYVDVINRRDKSSTSDGKSVTTGELAPGKVDSVNITEYSYSCISVQWAEVPLNKRNGTITGFEVKCGAKSEVNIPVADKRSYQDCRFPANSEITCSVKAVNGFGTGEGLNTSIFLCGLPAPPIFNLNETLSTDSLWRVLTVSIINVSDQKCESLTQVEVIISNGSDLVYQKNLTSHELSDLFGQLTAVTNFTVKLIAVNKYGNKSQPTSKWITTGELAPWSPPDRVKLDLINSTCGLLTWRKPVQSNGVILYYQTLCNNTAAAVFDDYMKATKTEVEQLTFCGLKPASLVECSVRANTSVGWSRVAADRGYTTPELKKPLEITEVIDSSEEQVTVQIAAVQFTSDNPIMYYQIIVEKVSTRKRRSTDDSLVDVDFLYNSTTAQTLNLTYYIAGRLYNQTDDFIRFTCGDNNTYGGYYNQPLETDTFYKIHYTYSLTVGGKLTTYSGPAIDVRRKPTTGLPPPPEESTISAALGALALLLIIPAVVIGFLVMRKRRTRGSPPDISERQVKGSLVTDLPNSTLNILVQSETAETSTSMKSNHNSVDSRPEQETYENLHRPDPRPQSVGVYSEIEDQPSSANTYMKLDDRDDNDHLYTKKTAIYENRRMTERYMNTEAIQLEDVSDRGKKCGVQADQPEYEDVSNIVSQPAHSSQLKAISGVNVDFASNVKETNRKLYDHRSNPHDSSISREFQDIAKQIRNLSLNYVAGHKQSNVVKNADPTILPAEYYRVKLRGGSDNYINAITVGSFENNSEFIVTQTPRQNTIEDFWLMVHEQRIVNIVQLEITEVQFIPGSNGKSLSVGNLIISRTGTQHNDNVEIIQLEISPPHVYNGAQWSGEITVFRYTDWNDGDIPDEQSIINLYLITKQDIQTYDSSTVVMCRDGGSKCGVYVNMFNILKKLEVEQIVDVYKSVLETRSRRPQFIDNIVSYSHMYDIVKMFTALHPQRLN